MEYKFRYAGEVDGEKYFTIICRRPEEIAYCNYVIKDGEIKPTDHDTVGRKTNTSVQSYENGAFKVLEPSVSSKVTFGEVELFVEEFGDREIDLGFNRGVVTIKGILKWDRMNDRLYMG